MGISDWLFRLPAPIRLIMYLIIYLNLYLIIYLIGDFVANPALIKKISGALSLSRLRQVEGGSICYKSGQ